MQEEDILSEGIGLSPTGDECLREDCSGTHDDDDDASVGEDQYTGGSHKNEILYALRNFTADGDSQVQYYY